MIVHSPISLRPLKSMDYAQIREVYIDAIISSGSQFYSNDQIDAWSSLASLSVVFDKSLN